MDEVRPAAETPSWFSRAGGAWITFLLCGLVATISQWIAISLAGFEIIPGAKVWSSGGVLAIICAFVMWGAVKSWSAFKRWIWLPLTITSLCSFAVVGLMNNYEVEILVREAQPATKSVQPNGLFELTETAERICQPGEDYLGCVNSHVAHFNSVCVDQPLTYTAASVCDSMSEFIEEIKAQYEGCGYGCETAGEYGTWGWPYLRLEPSMSLQFNNDAQPAVYHYEMCHFDLGIIQFGTCIPMDER